MSISWENHQPVSLSEIDSSGSADEFQPLLCQSAIGHIQDLGADVEKDTDFGLLCNNHVEESERLRGPTILVSNYRIEIVLGLEKMRQNPCIRS